MPFRFPAPLRRAALLPAPIVALALTPQMASARDSLGVFDSWGAFRDPGGTAGPRCYAIAAARPSGAARTRDPFASVATWPARRMRGQVYLRLSRDARADRPITLIINGRRFALTGRGLTGRGADAWAKDQRMDAAIVAAMREGVRMVVSATDTQGRRFSSIYDLSGVATALDAATMGCARYRTPR